MNTKKQKKQTTGESQNAQKKQKRSDNELQKMINKLQISMNDT